MTDQPEGPGELDERIHTGGNSELCTACQKIFSGMQLFNEYEHMTYGTLVYNAAHGCPLCAMSSLHFSSQSDGVQDGQMFKTWLSFKSRLNDGLTPIIWARLVDSAESSPIELHMVPLTGKSFWWQAWNTAYHHH